MFSANHLPVFEDDHWTLVERQFDKEANRTWETLFSLGNGYVGTRGSFEEGLPGFSTEGTYINGFYESFPLAYEEGFIGYASSGQRILSLANAKAIRVAFEDGEVYDPLAPQSRLTACRRALDLRAGILTRDLTWTSPTGKRLHLRSERLVSFKYPHIIALRLTITPEAVGSTLAISSLIDYRVQRETGDAHDPRSATDLDKIQVSSEPPQIVDRGVYLVQRTHRSQIAAVIALRDQFPNQTVLETSPVNEVGTCAGHRYTLAANQAIVLEKYIACCTSFDTRPDSLIFTASDELDRAATLGFGDLCAEQRAYLARFWDEAADIRITADDPRLQGAIRLNMFHLLQSAGRDGYTSIPAKGLTGDGYDGHYFWDTESYMLPFFLHTVPGIARALLEYRYHTLDRARHRAREMAHPSGALFPWRGINGDECSANYPTGTAQVHINADIAYAVRRYYEITGDQAFMLHYGAEMLFETARLWADVGAFIPSKDGKFCIHGVTGPDEYTTLVDNNTYTNLMARENLAFAAEIARWMRDHFAEDFRRVAEKIGLEPGEMVLWQQAADRMYVPEPQAVKDPSGTIQRITPQDDSFLSRPEWDERRGELRGERPLLLRYHPLVFNRYQVSKQADLILAEFVLGDAFEADQKRRDFEYYEPRTTHDSSLSRCIFSIMAAELAAPDDPGDRYLHQAAEFYRDSATIDLDDHRGETKKGIHAANMGGSWMGIVFGFARLRASRDRLSLGPVVPPGWTAYRFKVFYQGRRIQVQVERTDRRPRVILTLLAGEPLDVIAYGESCALRPGEPVECRAG